MSTTRAPGSGAIPASSTTRPTSTSASRPRRTPGSTSTSATSPRTGGDRAAAHRRAGGRAARHQPEPGLRADLRRQRDGRQAAIAPRPFASQPRGAAHRAIRNQPAPRPDHGAIQHNRRSINMTLIIILAVVAYLAFHLTNNSFYKTTIM